MNEYEKFFLKFPYIFSKTTFSLYFYKLYKFMIICYNRFQRLSEFNQIMKHISTIFLKTSIKFELVFCKIFTNFIHNLPKIFKNFLNDFQNLPDFSANIPLIFFQNFNK